ncbi:MAG: phytanoyl-CoA dioxygenase family protein [Armatimonadetes bacterium]|nr:phytanoyl-CoA dioxygenase family protein [Armatimonadota bacterium]
MSPLSVEQRAAFDRDGFLLIPGLIPDEIAARAEAAVWEKLEADPSDPSTWEGKPVGSGHDSPNVTAIFTLEMARLVDELCGETQPDWQAPRSAFAINIFPQAGPWAHHGPHIDHALERDNFQVFPRPMRLASLLYLTDCKREGAPTVVWPGSHKKIEAFAKSDPERFKRMFTLNNALGELDLGEGIQVEGRRGDVLFYHYLCAHSGSRNTRDYPRFAIAHKW